MCVCVCRITGLVECVEESEGVRRDGAWEQAGLQQRPPAQALLHQPSHVSLLIHLAVSQAITRLRQERPLVTPAVQVRDMHPVLAAYDALSPNLVSVRIAEEGA